MPIYEFACPKCRRIFSFLAKTSNTGRRPVCPKCGHKKLDRQMSAFAMPRGAREPAAAPGPGGDGLPDLDHPRMERAMAEMERDLEHLDENNPRHMAHVLRKMKDAMPGAAPEEIETAIRRLEAGESIEKIEADLGGIFGDDPEGDSSGGSGGGGNYSRDSGLYDY